MEILFVCTGNTCRSPMAEGILKSFNESLSLGLGVKSAGTSVYTPSMASKSSIRVMEDIGIDIRDHISSQIKKQDIEEADLVLTMASSHKSMILSSYPEFQDKVYSLLEYAYGVDSDIMDPFGQSAVFYEETRDMIYRAISSIVKNKL